MTMDNAMRTSNWRGGIIIPSKPPPKNEPTGRAA